MPSIPLVQSERPSITALPTPEASAAAFGSREGAALGQLGEAIGGAGASLAAWGERDRRVKAANLEAGWNFAPSFMEMQQTAPVGATDFTQNVLKRYDEEAARYAENIPDNLTREQVKLRQAKERTTYQNQSIEFQYKSNEQANKIASNDAVNANINNTAADPKLYDLSLEKIQTVIDGQPGIDATTKASMKQAAQQTLAKQRFAGATEAAVTPEQVGQIEKELQDDKWKSALNPADYNAAVNDARVRRNAISSTTKASATAAVSGLTADERYKKSVIPDDELRDTKAKAEAAAALGDETQIRKFNEVVVYQEERRRAANMPYAELQRWKQENDSKGAAGAVTNAKTYIPQGVAMGSTASTFAMAAGNVGGNVPALMATAERESGFKPASGGTGTIRGGYQMSGDLRRRYGIGNSDDVNVQTEGAHRHMLYLESAMAKQIGRKPSSAETYLGWHFGEAGGASLIALAQKSPEMSTVEWVKIVAGDQWQAWLSGNPHIAKAGTVGNLYAETVSNMRSRIAKFGGDGDAPYSGGQAVPGGLTRGDYVRNNAIDDLVKQREAAMSRTGDMMSYSAANSTNPAMQPNDLSEENGYSNRGSIARMVAEFNSVPDSDTNPFTKDEASELERQIKNGSASEKAAAFANVSQLGGDMAKAGFRQVGQGDANVAYVGEVYQRRPETAMQVVQGQDILKNDKALAGSLFDGGKPDVDFRATTATALSGLSPETRGAIFEAAKAHYAYKMQGTSGAYSAGGFQESVNAVLGGSSGAPAVANVAAGPMILPEGVSAERMNTAVAKAAPQDYVELSVDGLPPRHGNGDIVRPYEIENGATFEFVGDDTYRLRFYDGTYAVSQKKGGVYSKYEAEITRDKIDKIAERKLDPANPMGAPAGGWKSEYK